MNRNLKKDILHYNNKMELNEIKENYRYLIIDSHSGESHIVKTDRLVREFLENTYDISVSHMFIRRNLETVEDVILREGILIKLLW